MRTTLNAPIVFDHKGYYYPEKTYCLSAGYATAAEMLAFGMAKNLLSLYRNTPLCKTARLELPLAGPPPNQMQIIRRGMKTVLWCRHLLLLILKSGIASYYNETKNAADIADCKEIIENIKRKD
ncbi:MAG: hypothetical protein LBT13_07330 [Treponema sp.]|jgi:hypothetical protein|nr:hypothetical protein [Treponema sp.]